jgi:hypothetical protein
LLKDAWGRVASESGCHLFTLLGAAGVGKSRLVVELLDGVGDRALVLRGRCLPYGEGITFWPLIEALMPVGDRAALALERLTVGGAAVPQELFWDVRRLLESLASERAVILHVDDLQWGEQMLFDLIDHVIDLSRGSPILLLCTARPELLEERSGWGGGKLNAQTALLEPLGPAESLALLDQLGDGLDSDTRARVVEASEGNPLYLEEMVALARESGEVSVPSTIQALLAARLERLGEEERELLEHGAVEGEVFHRHALLALAGERLAGQLDATLAGLVRRELIRPHPATFTGDEAFRFRHLLIRDAAYDALPKSERARLHEAFAGWLETSAPHLVELDEIAGWHLEQTVRYRRELGQRADPELTLRATEHMHLAGQRAGRRGDVIAARNLLERAIALAADDEHLRAEIGVELAEQLHDFGDYELVDELLSAAERHDDLAALAALTRFEWRMQAQPEDLIQKIDTRLPAIIEELQHRGDERGLAKAHLVWALRYNFTARAASMADHDKRAVEYAARAGDDALRERATSQLIAALCFGERHSSEVRREVEAIAGGDEGPLLRANLETALAWLAELDGHFEQARAHQARSLESFEAMGMRERVGASYQRIAIREMLAGDAVAARAAAQRGDHILAELGERSFRSTVQAWLAQANAELGDRDGALAAVELAEQLGAAEDVINHVFTHGVRATLALADGDLDTAERWARSAVEYADRTDWYLLRTNSRLGLSRVLAARGANDQARAEAQTALDICIRKGDRPRAAQARAQLDQLQA